jgi:hypothetical protein
VSSYYSQIAAHMLEADRVRFRGRYQAALRAGFIRHGILSLNAATDVTREVAGRGIAAASSRGNERELAYVVLPGVRMGFTSDVLALAPSEAKRFGVAGSHPAVGSIQPAAADRAALGFVEDLARQGRLAVESDISEEAELTGPLTRKTHEIKRSATGLVLARRYFDCAWCSRARR